jgi:hypothetical protein
MHSWWNTYLQLTSDVLCPCKVSGWLTFFDESTLIFLACVLYMNFSSFSPVELHCRKLMNKILILASGIMTSPLVGLAVGYWHHIIRQGARVWSASDGLWCCTFQRHEALLGRSYELATLKYNTKTVARILVAWKWGQGFIQPNQPDAASFSSISHYSH